MIIIKQLISMLSNAQLKASVVLLILIFMGMLLETLSIGLIIPALSLMLTTNLVEDYPALEPLLQYLGNPEPVQLVLGAMFILVTIYAFKTVYLVYLSWKQASFTYGLQQSLSQQLFVGYLRQPYTFHLQRNSAQLIRNTNSEVSIFTNAITAIIEIITESLVLVGIMVLLLFFQPLGAGLVIGILGSVSYGFYYVTKERNLRWGIARQYHEGFKIQHLQQGLGSVKDVKVLGREDSFFSQYGIHNKGSANMGRNSSILQALPRLGLELLAVIGLVVLVVTMLTQNKSFESLIPTLGLFAAAAFRLMPSANRIIRCIQKFRYALPSIDVLSKELHLIKNNKVLKKEAKPLLLEHHIELKHIDYIYPETDQKVLNDINIQIESGTTVGFIGSSGSGKSTLINLILGLLPPSNGEVKIDNVDIDTNMRGWQNQIGYVPQTIYLTDDTLRHNIAFGLEEDQIDDGALQAAIKAAQLEGFISDLPEGYNSIVGEQGVKLSGGQRQRIGVARALYHDPAVLVLDEATSALDTETEKGVMQAIIALQGKKTILIVAHRLSTLKQCDLLYKIENGKIVHQGLYDELVDVDSG